MTGQQGSLVCAGRMSHSPNNTSLQQETSCAPQFISPKLHSTVLSLRSSGDVFPSFLPFTLFFPFSRLILLRHPHQLILIFVVVDFSLRVPFLSSIFSSFNHSSPIFFLPRSSPFFFFFNFIHLFFSFLLLFFLFPPSFQFVTSNFNVVLHPSLLLFSPT